MISICIPAYKAARFLPKTLASVREQLFTDWELILVEDGSDDGTRGIIETFATSVRQTVRYLRHEQNRGLTATRNTGISAARSDWIAILDADDVWTPEHLSACAEAAQASDADVVHGGSQLFDSDTGRDLETRVPDDAALATVPLSVFTQQYIIQPSSIVMKRALWEQVGGFDTTFQHVEDLEMWLRCLRAGAAIHYSGKVTCRYRKHASAMSGESYPMAAAFARVYARHLDWEAIPRRVRRERAMAGFVAAARLCWRKKPARATLHLFSALCSVLGLRVVSST
ncbi:MAG: glycosyltransferase family 2 protein [Opitutales bacterium]|nr:glycosyltransferase family 2 protein [Opitutales bacterium]